MPVGVDIGGTFTDLVLSRDGGLTVHKLLSTPADPAQAMLAGLAALSQDGAGPVAHGSTVATNAILQRRGARVALITTQGFRDVLLIGRQNRPVLYALQPQLPPPLVPRERCYEVPERLDHTGEVLTALDMAALEAVLDQIAGQGVDAVAVCFLYSYINPQHEQAVRERIIARGMLEEWQVALSSDVLPEFREYERASTVALEAYVRPVMAGYVGRLAEKLPQGSGLRIMKSDGGVMSAARVRRQAVHTALSGPAAGVIGAFHIARLAGCEQIITLDMGGTSTDVALCPGRTVVRPESDIDGLPLRVRLLDIETIGAGGGSIARVDAGGALRVGPESAGADPGPIIYGRGGKQVTVSDANAVLGRLDPDHFLGGGMKLKLKPAHTAVAALGRGMGMGEMAAARGVIEIANVNIDRALRRVSIARGYDPRGFTLVAFGGAGPLHACEVAQRLEIPRVLVPRYPGVLCAFGLLVADVALEYAQPVMARASRGVVARVRAAQSELIALGRQALLDEGIAEEAIGYEVLLDMRYAGQAHELTVPFKGDVVQAFHEAHERAYGHAMPQRTVEIINMRLQAVGLVEKPLLTPEDLTETTAEAALLGRKKTPDGAELALYEREKLAPGARFAGQALVFQLDSTLYVPPGWTAAVDAYRNIVLERG